MKIDNRISEHLSVYMPADYIDNFTYDIKAENEISSEEVLKIIFTRPPQWIDALMRLRNKLVKPLGLKIGNFADHIEEAIKFRSHSETILGMSDLHLDFYVSIECSAMYDNSQSLSVTTLVKYNNALGKIYFFIIRSFHKLIIKSSLKSIKA